MRDPRLRRRLSLEAPIRNPDGSGGFSKGWFELGSLSLAGRRFETWDEVAEAVARATDYWNAHRHPFTWGQRRRHRPHDLPDPRSGNADRSARSRARP